MPDVERDPQDRIRELETEVECLRAEQAGAPGGMGMPIALLAASGLLLALLAFGMAASGGDYQRLFAEMGVELPAPTLLLLSPLGAAGFKLCAGVLGLAVIGIGLCGLTKTLPSRVTLVLQGTLCLILTVLLGITHLALHLPLVKMGQALAQ